MIKYANLAFGLSYPIKNPHLNDGGFEVKIIIGLLQQYHLSGLRIITYGEPVEINAGSDFRGVPVDGILARVEMSRKIGDFLSGEIVNTDGNVGFALDGKRDVGSGIERVRIVLREGERGGCEILVFYAYLSRLRVDLNHDV